jgi:two-component system, sensor histidine kinase and response regulator
MNEFGGALFDAPQPSDQLAAFGLTVAISMIFAFVAPFAWIPLKNIPLFLPIYDSALAVSYLITTAFFAVLFIARGGTGLLFLSAGYLWTTLLAAAHMLSFPGVSTQIALLSGPQTTAWLYMVWHIGFPAAVALNAVAGSSMIGSRPRALMIAGFVVAGLVAGLVTLCADAQRLLPAIVKEDRWQPLLIFTAYGICAVAAIALGGLIRGRTRLDLWLAVILYASIGDILLSAVLNAERYDLGWYAGRLFGVIEAGLILYRVLQLAVVDRYRRVS